MPTSPLQETVRKWNMIAAKASRSGIPLSLFKQLGDDDIARVSQGHSGMSQEEAEAAVLAAANHPPIAPQQRRTNPAAILGNVPHDIEDIARGLNPVTLARSLYREAKAIPSGIHLTSEVHSPQQALRNLAETPGLRLIPGVHTGAGLTTSEGRKGLERHPVGTILDILPIAGAASKTAGLAAGEGTIAQSLQEMKLGQAAYRTLPEAIRLPLGAKTTDILRTFHLDADSRALWRAKSEADTATLAQLHHFVDRKLAPLIDGMSDQERVLLYHEATNPEAFPHPIPEHEAILNSVRELNASFAAQGTAMGKLIPLTILGKHLYYSTEGPEGAVVSGLSRSEFHQSRLEAAVENLRTTQTRIDRRTTNLRKLIEREHEKIRTGMGKGEGKRLIQAQQRLYRHEETLRAVENDPVLLRRQAKVQKRLAKVHAVNQTLAKKFLMNAPAEYHPMMQTELIARAKIIAEGKYGTGSPMLEASLAKMEQGDFSTVFTKPEWKDITNEIRSTWTRYVATGLDPVWVHSVREHQFDLATRTQPLAERYITPASVRAKVFNVQPRLHDLGIGLTATASEYIRTLGTEELILSHVKPYLLTDEEVNADLQPLLAKELRRGIAPMSSKASTLDKLRATRYEKFDPAAMWNFTTPRLRALASEHDYYLPNHIATAVKGITRPPERSALGRVASRTTTVFKTSVLAFSPRYMAHTFFGGATMLLLRGHWDDWASIGKAIEYAKDPTLFPSAVSHGLDQLTTDQILHEAGGTKLAALWGKVVGPDKGFYHAHEFVANTQRAMAFLGGESRGLRHGLTPEMAIRMGIEHANKVFIDWNGMSQLERTIIRQVFPFYAFTRHIVGYVLTYPFDHPIRASILANFAEAEQKDWDSGLPKTFQNLFYIGTPDKQGNVAAIDTRTLNPFRDVANYFTIRGFFTSVHPIIQGLLEAGGVNPITGSPQLYSDLTIDEATGKLVAKRPPNLALNFLTNIIPEVGAIDHFTQYSANLRTLKTTNPTSYRKQLFNALNIPFVPYNYNLPSIKGKEEVTRYRVASQAVSRAEVSNKWGDVTRFNAVPYAGGVVDPRQLEAQWQRLILAIQQARLGSVNPRAVLPHKRARARLL